MTVENAATGKFLNNLLMALQGLPFVVGFVQDALKLNEYRGNFAERFF